MTARTIVFIHGNFVTKGCWDKFARPPAPLLFIAGSDDHIMPASFNRTNHARDKTAGSVTAFKEFPGRTHDLIAQDGWEEIADYALDWALAQVGEASGKREEPMPATV